MDEPSIIIIVCLTFLLAGTIKGIIGLGLPTVSLVILSLAINLPTAMALLLIPSFVTNVWQATNGGNGKAVLERIWPFLVMATVTVWIGSKSLRQIDLIWLTALLGLLLVIYASTYLLGFKLEIKGRKATPIGVMIGLINGVFTGMTGSFVVPGVMYLQALGFSRDALIQSMGMLFTVSTIALGIALKQNDFLTAELGILSGVALIPAILGMIVGQNIRKVLSEHLFRRVFFISLILLGIYMCLNTLIDVNMY